MASPKTAWRSSIGEHPNHGAETPEVPSRLCVIVEQPCEGNVMPSELSAPMPYSAPKSNSVDGQYGPVDTGVDEWRG